MLSHVSTYYRIPEEEPSSKGWSSTADYNQQTVVPTSKSMVAAIEVLIGIGAVSLLVLSQQNWPEDFWLHHPAAFIGGAAVSGFVGLDIAVAIGIRIHAAIKSPPQKMKETNTSEAPVKLEKGTLEFQRWLSKRAQTEHNDIRDGFCLALAKAGLKADNYQLIIFRPAQPIGFGYDFVLRDNQDNNPYNLRNYAPNSILIVTHYDGLSSVFWEHDIIKDPTRGGRPAMRDYLGDQFVHVHLNEHDVSLLQQAILSEKILHVIRNKSTFGSTRLK
jgi:hypothetical protein